MKQGLIVLALIASLIGGATIYGLKRAGGTAAPTADVSAKLLLAQKFSQGNEPGRALQVLDELSADGRSLGEEADLLRLQALDRAQRHTEAREAADKFLKNFPNSTMRAEAELVQLTAELASSSTTNPALRQNVEEFLQRNPDHAGAFRLNAALARQDLAVGDYVAAQRRLNSVLNSKTADSPEIFEIAELLGRANLERLHSSSPADGDSVYTVLSGDSINRIANRHKVTEELLMRSNNITNPRALQVGQKLRVPNVNFSLHVDISANTMTLKNHGEFFKLYRVRTGRENGTTPTGEFRVLNKKTDPTWRPGNGHVYLPGDPNNELGTRWMAFEGDILGIHGTLHPDTIGHYASNGCVALNTEEVEELFDLVTVGTPLFIEGQQDLTRHKIIPAPSIPAPRQVASN